MAAAKRKTAPKKAKPQDHKITQKQELFAQKYVELGEASSAYREAYDVGEKTKPTTIWVEAHKVLSNPKVAKRVLELQERHQKRHDVTIDSLTKELDEDRQLARDNVQPSAAISAVMGKAKLHGLGSDKVELSLGDEVLTALQGARSRVGKKKG